jgi:hypothetical protein
MKPETDNLITGSGPPNAPAQCKAERTKLNMPRTSPIPTETAQAYATSTDFCRVFVENTDSMHLLSFLLTADQAKAEECFVSGLEGCVKGNHVFRDWASSWARRTIILKAVRMLAPGRDHDTAAPVPGDPVNCKFGRTPQADAAIASILGLGDFERFVFVMSVLERYSDQDCSARGRMCVRQGCERYSMSPSQTGYALHCRATAQKRWWHTLHDRWSSQIYCSLGVCAKMLRSS